MSAGDTCSGAKGKHVSGGSTGAKGDVTTLNGVVGLENSEKVAFEKIRRSTWKPGVREPQPGRTACAKALRGKHTGNVW